MTLNCHFLPISFFVVSLTRFFCIVSGDNYVKTNKNTLVSQAREVFTRNLVSANIRFMRIFARLCARGGVS